MPPSGLSLWEQTGASDRGGGVPREGQEAARAWGASLTSLPSFPPLFLTAAGGIVSGRRIRPQPNPQYP